MTNVNEGVKKAILQSIQRDDGVSVVDLPNSPSLRGYSESEVYAGLRALRLEQRITLAPNRRSLHYGAPVRRAVATTSAR